MFVNFKSGRKSKCNTTSMASQCGPERCFKGFAMFAADGQRKRKEEIEKREERKRMKEGNPECMTVQLLREVLEEMGEPYSKSWKKTQLIQRVRAAREKHNSTADLISSATTMASTASQPSTGPSGNVFRNSAGHLSSGPRSEFTNAKLTIFSSSKEQVSATNGDSLFPRKRSIAGSVTVLYYYDEEKERIIHLLLHILFIFDLISISMDNITYYFVITALTSINAFLLINCVGFLYSSLLGLIMLLLICYMFARANVISVCKDVNFRHAVNDPLPMTVR